MSNSSAVCVDASVVLRRTLQPDDDVIKELWQSWVDDEIRLVAPTLLFYEVTNGLYRQQRNKVLSPETVWKALELALDLPINLVNEANFHLRALELATKYNLPAAYDAHYLALAEWMDIEFWTADMKLINTLKPFKFDWVKGIE